MSQITLMQALAVAAGSAAGGLLRWLAGVVLNPLWGGFGLGTLVVNCLGGFAIGAAIVWFARTPDEVLRLFVITGVLGGFTTFSSFSAESLSLVQRGEWPLALAHTLAHVVGALLCAGLGFKLGRMLLA
jgi:fluoride exporter